MDTTSDWVLLSVRTNPTPLEDEPQEFEAESKTETSVLLKWKPSQRGDETNYELQRQQGLEWVTIAEPVVLSHIDTSLTPDTVYNYRLRSVKK